MNNTNLQQENNLRVIAYGDANFSQEIDKMEVPINPGTISISSNINYGIYSAFGSMSYHNRYNTVEPRIMSFSIILDGTGCISGKFYDVQAEYDKFYQLTSVYNEKIKSPNFIRIIWGELDFKGRLSNMNSSFVMFDKSGRKTRAKIDVKIIECLSSATHERGNSSVQSNDTSRNFSQNKESMAANKDPEANNEMISQKDSEQTRAVSKQEQDTASNNLPNESSKYTTTPITPNTPNINIASPTIKTHDSLWLLMHHIKKKLSNPNKLR